jgi:hypothetical protein
MRKLFSTFSLMLLYVTIAFGQAFIDIPLSGTDGTYTLPLAVGLDPTATNGIDLSLGESDLPPFPPLGAFEIRFDLQPYAGEPLSSYKDYRNAASFPFSGQIEHLLWWQTSGPDLPIDVQYDLPNGAAMTLRDQLGGVILNLGPFTGSGTVTIPGSYTNVFAKCLLLMDYVNVIPVELTSFTAIAKDEGVLLNWTTATEINNHIFEIERKTEKTEFRTIGYVEGNGTTTEPRSYSFTDRNAENGINYYRLKQIDYNGTFSYSPIVEVDVASPLTFNLSQNYPNPFNPSTTIEFSLPEDVSNVKLSIYNTLGIKVAELVNTNLVAGQYSYQWDASNVATGTYFYELRTDKFVSVKKMILMK